MVASGVASKVSKPVHSLTSSLKLNSAVGSRLCGNSTCYQFHHAEGNRRLCSSNRSYRSIRQDRYSDVLCQHEHGRRDAAGSQIPLDGGEAEVRLSNAFGLERDAYAAMIGSHRSLLASKIQTLLRTALRGDVRSAAVLVIRSRLVLRFVVGLSSLHICSLSL